MVQRLASWTLIAATHRATGPALAVQHQHYHQQQQAGQLGSTRQAEEAIPGLVDRGGKGVEVEHRHRAEIRQGLHQRQRHARTDGRPGHRQRHAPERLPRRLPEHPGGFHQALALGQEGTSRQQIDVRVEDQHQHQDHPAGGADPGQAQAAAEPFTHQRLHGAGKIQQANEDKRQHIGRNRKRQHQRPVEPTSPRELAQTGEPGQTDTQQRHPDPHAKDQREGVAQQAWHLRIPQVGPDLLVDALPGQQQDAKGQQDQRGDGEDQGIPAALGGVGQGILSLNKRSCGEGACSRWAL
ncbi:hypothetical protein D3C78_1032800 [compost metagenome]